MLICPFLWIALHYTFVIHFSIFRSKEYISCFGWRSRGISLLAPSISQHQLETIGRKVSNPHQIYSGNLLVLMYPVGSMYGIRYTCKILSPPFWADLILIKKWPNQEFWQLRARRLQMRSTEFHRFHVSPSLNFQPAVRFSKSKEIQTRQLIIQGIPKENWPTTTSQTSILPNRAIF